MDRKSAIALAALLLAACATAPDDAPAPAPIAAVCPPSDNWQVWIDLAPRGDKDLALFADGEVTVPAGMVARLKPGPLDRMMPPGQRFVLELFPGKGPAGPQRVRGAVQPALPRYREVIVTCGGETIARIAGDSIETAD